ncbi:PfkB family carbohydrate kinase [Candidatus Berkiella aquae]|uniref:5-dehydro-2-deoxygluconokinase n=1 Tax=Candidatus Berkiella aquae TaxID=295108 RepID=A0A0Q9YVL5_9GAMM|nr:PfkB family carbohydrate kinase [Candidatus Berkiella aquae]MCS5710118.1 DUF2090 domain-containing protein [Candidatus Berkiella aquae]
MKKSNKLFDVIVLGPAHVELRGQQQGSALKNMLSFEKSLGKDAAMLAVGLSRLGAKSALISSIGRDAMGQFIIDTLSDNAVDISQVNTTHHHLTALTIQNGDHGAGQTIHYSPYNNESSVQFNEDFLLKSCSLLICSQILNDSTFMSKAPDIIKRIKEQQVKIILLLDDLLALKNIKLPEITPLLAMTDVIIGRESDYIQILDKANIDDAISSLAQMTKAISVIKRGQHCYIPSLCNHQGFNLEFKGVNIIATAIGFAAAWLHDKTLEQCCEHANAAETLIALNTQAPSLEALSFFLDHQNQVVAHSIQSASFANLCYSSVQKRLKKPLFLVSLGDHKLWQKMAEPYGIKEETLQLAKQFVGEAIMQGFSHESMAGLIFEDESAFKCQDWSEKVSWLACSLEKTGEVPLQFTYDVELTGILSQWPEHHVAKISVTYHPDDRYSLRGQQEALLAQLHHVCRNTKHALLIDLVMPMNSLLTAKTHAHILQRFYELGIYPDYWQVSMPRDQRSWENIHNVIQDNAPFCQGIIVNAAFASLEQLPTLIDICGKEKICQGLVVGRGLFQHCVEQWFAKKIDDQMLVHLISDALRQTANLWYEKCQSELLIDHLMPRSWQIYS